MAELDKFKRRLIRSVARLRLKEKVPPAKMWTILNKETGRDTKAIWKRMSVLCLKKLSRLLAADDYPSGVPQLARMSVTDWIMFDLVLVHEEPDVCSLPKDSGISEGTLTAFQDLLQLVKHHGLDRYSSQESSLAETWAELTLKYNEPGREASPMLLQLRWHQMRTSARAAFYQFWQIFRGFARNLPRASECMPTQLHLTIVKMFPTIITSQLDSWTELIQKKNVVLFDQFVITKGSENSAIKKVYEQGCFLPPDNIDGGTTAASTNDPDIVLLEPKIDTITLEDDSDSEIAEKNTTTETDSSTCLQNDYLRDAKKSIKNTENVEADTDISNQVLGIKIKQEPEEEMEVDGLINVKIIEASHVPTEEIDETDEQAQGPGIDKETENATSILDNLLNLEKSVDNTELLQIIDERSLDDCIISGEENKENREEERNCDEDLNDIMETIEVCSEVVDKTTTTEALQSHDLLTEDNINDCVTSREGKQSNEECDVENNHDEDRYNIIPETIEYCSEVKEKKSTTEALQSYDMPREGSFDDCIMSRGEKEKTDQHEKETHLDEDRNDVIKKTVEDCSDAIDKTTTTEALQSHYMASEGLEKPTEDAKISSKNDVEFNSLTELPSSIELLDDGIDICEEDDDLFYHDNTVRNDYGGEIKSEPTEDAEGSEEEFKIDEDSEPAKFDLKLIMFPVVYTTKLEDMTLFQEADYETVKTDVLIEAITAESKPVSKKSINIKPAEIMTKETKVIAFINEEKRNSEDLIKLVPYNDVHDDVVHDDDVHDFDVHDDDVQDDDLHDDDFQDDDESDIDEIHDAERVNITSTLFKKPTYRNYNSISVCKNPDFNTRLKRLSAGFFTYERNMQLYNACKPLTVDLHKSFETKLDNGIIYLKKEKSNSPTTVSDPINYQPVSVTPSALPAQCLIDNRKSDIQELIPAKNLTIDEDLMNEQQKVISLPHIDKACRINKQLLTVEVSPLLEQNHDIDINIVESVNSNSKSIDSDQAIETIMTEDAKIDMTSTVEAVSKPANDVVEYANKPLLSLEISPLYLNIPPTTVSGDKLNSANTIVSNLPAKAKKPKKTNVSTNVNGTVPWYLRKLNRDIPVIVNKSKEDEALITADSLYSMIEVMEGKWSEGKKISNEKKQFTKKYYEQSSKEVDKTTEKAPNPIAKNPRKPKKRTRKKKEYCCWALEKYCCDMIMSRKQSQRKQNSNLKKIHECGSVCSCCCRHILAKSFEDRDANLDSDLEKSQYSTDAIEKAIDLIKDTNEEIDLPTDNTTPAVSVITNCKDAGSKDAETLPLHNISDIDNCFGNLVNLIESKTQIAATSDTIVSENEKPLPKLNSSGSNELIILSDEEDNEKIVTANHLEPKWTTTPFSQNNKNQLASPPTSTSPAKKVASSKYIINYKKTLTPECPIKLGKNQILLTSVKIPSHLLGNQLTYLPEPVVSPPILDQSRLMIPEIPLPKGVSLVMHPDGQLNASLEDGVVLQYDDLKKVENVVSTVQRQIYLHFGVGTESDASKFDVDVTNTNVIDLVNNATEGITDTDVNTNIETCEEVTNTITHVPSTDLSIAIDNESCESSNSVSNPNFEANHDSNNDAPLGAKQQNSPLCQNDQNEVGHTNIASEKNKKDLAQLYNENSESHDMNKNEDAAKSQDYVSKSHLNDVVSETSGNGKKSILSDLMEMSGISSEDVQPSTTEVQLPYLYPALDCAIDAIDQQPCTVLTQVTSVECLKYAYNQNGKFFKMDMNTEHIKRIDVSIEKRKQVLKQIKRIYVPQPPPAPNPRTLVIDLTNQDHLSQATKPIISLKPLQKYNSKSKVCNEVQTRLLSEINQLKTHQISILRKHIHLRNFMKLSKSNREEIKNKIQNQINLVDSDEPMMEEYLIESDEDDDISELTSHNNNKRTHQDVSSDDSDDEPLAKKMQRKKDEARNIEREICNAKVPVDTIEQDEEYEIEQLEDDNDMFSDASHDSGECILGA